MIVDMATMNKPIVCILAVLLFVGLGTTSCVSFNRQYLDVAIPYRTWAIIPKIDSGKIEVHYLHRSYIGAADPNLIYASFYRDSIYQTQGGYQGYVLHGRYIERHANSGLRVLGAYRHGLKRGKWYYWDKEGKLRKEERWQYGQLSGRFFIYGTDGSILQAGYMTNGSYRVLITVDTTDGNFTRNIKRFNKGVELGISDGSWGRRMSDAMISFWLR